MSQWMNQAENPRV